MFWKKIYNIYNSDHVQKATSFIHKSLESATNIREIPNAIDYLNLSFNLRKNYLEVYGACPDPFNYFSNENWTCLMSRGHPFFSEVLKLIRSHKESKLFTICKDTDGTIVSQIKLQKLTFGTIFYDGQVFHLYIKTSDLNFYDKFLENLFWSQFKIPQVLLTFEEKKAEFSVILDISGQNFLPSRKASEIAQELSLYLQQGFNRSILLYGPPGSGKSMCVRAIVHHLQTRTLRISLSHFISSFNLLEIFRWLNPNVIILEDVDRFSEAAIADLLDKMERLNFSCQILLATANYATALDDALIRPGRFDQVIEIKTLEKDIANQMVGEDLELLALAETWPAAYIQELMKRCQVLGREKALASINDLKTRLKNSKGENYTLDVNHE